MNIQIIKECYLDDMNRKFLTDIGGIRASELLDKSLRETMYQMSFLGLVWYAFPEDDTERLFGKKPPFVVYDVTVDDGEITLSCKGQKSKRIENKWTKLLHKRLPEFNSASLEWKA